MFVWRPGLRWLLASAGGRGLLAASDDLLAEKRTGKQVLNLREDDRALLCIPAEGDHVAVVGGARNLLVFPLAEVPEVSRGSGVALQKYVKGKGGKLADAKVFRIEEGLTWPFGDKIRTERNLTGWLGARGQVGKSPPTGFPRSGRFS